MTINGLQEVHHRLKYIYTYVKCEVHLWWASISVHDNQ